MPAAWRLPRPWPRSLAARTALVLVTSLVVVQVAGLTIHALDRVDVIRLAQARDLAVRTIGLYQLVVLTPPEQRAALLAGQKSSQGNEGVALLGARLETGPPAGMGPPAPLGLQRLIRVNMGLVPAPPGLRPREVVIDGDLDQQRVGVGLRLPDARWLDLSFTLPPPRPWHSQTFLAAFLLMTVTAAGLSVWAVRRLVAPVATLAAAAERLGRDVSAPPLPEDGPTEVAQAASAFNTMAGRIRRFVQDRTFLLAAIGHDLRTPITRMRLRAEFIEDEEQRRRMLADLDELQAMVSATLTFARDATAGEPLVAIDLAELARTVLDEVYDTRGDGRGALDYAGPEHLPVRVRPISLKRALTNLVTNALKYGAAARVTVLPPERGVLQVRVDDDGPGIPEADLERVFQPFTRLEASRSRETGGTGLGLPIARNIVRAHGGDLVLSNRAGGGLRATMTLPA
jgi:signal transduction histidine kinase